MFIYLTHGTVLVKETIDSFHPVITVLFLLVEMDGEENNNNNIRRKIKLLTGQSTFEIQSSVTTYSIIFVFLLGDKDRTFLSQM